MKLLDIRTHGIPVESPVSPHLIIPCFNRCKMGSPTASNPTSGQHHYDQTDNKPVITHDEDGGDIDPKAEVEPLRTFDPAFMKRTQRKVSLSLYTWTNANDLGRPASHSSLDPRLSLFYARQIQLRECKDPRYDYRLWRRPIRRKIRSSQCVLLYQLCAI